MRTARDTGQAALINRNPRLDDLTTTAFSTLRLSGSAVALRNAVDALGMRGVGAVRGEVAIDTRGLRIRGR